MTRNIILGRDWLAKENVTIYHGLHKMNIKGVNLSLVNDHHISSLARVHKSVNLPPRSTTLCFAKLKNHANFQANSLCYIDPPSTRFLSQNPDLEICPSLFKMSSQKNHIPITVINNSDRHMRIRAGCVLASVHTTNEHEISSISEHVNTLSDSENNSDTQPNFSVPSDHKSTVEALLSDNSDLFAEKDTDLTQTDLVTMSIDTGDHPPIKLRPYRAPLTQQAQISDAVDQMLEAKVIEPSNSPWSFPCILVKKKDGSLRFCIDYRKLNAITRPNSWPLPLIDDILAKLGKSMYFTSLDLRSGYWQLLLNPDDRPKTAFTCHRGLFQFRVVPFGLMNAPQVFSYAISQLLNGMQHFAVAYLDDILIFSRSAEEHLNHINQVFDRLRQHSFKLKLKKCAFFQTETTYLGFTINRQGIKPEENKVNAIRNMPRPKTVKQCRSFVSLCSYYRRFIPNFSANASPIIHLTKRNMSNSNGHPNVLKLLTI